MHRSSSRTLLTIPSRRNALVQLTDTYSAATAIRQSRSYPTPLRDSVHAHALRTPKSKPSSMFTVQPDGGSSHDDVQRSAANASPAFDPHTYTHGRWLVRERLELQARRIEFDFDALCRRVVQVCGGSSAIRSCTKREGGFNRVFLFVFEDDKHVAAKLPFSLAGPRSLVTNSEVATIQYRMYGPLQGLNDLDTDHRIQVQSNTSIPIPYDTGLERRSLGCRR
ncbi:hypothetical protein MRB53_038289 [Persea americana]|nr:hypothetical protein MRB53_038289 [Persea americana]